MVKFLENPLHGCCVLLRSDLHFCLLLLWGQLCASCADSHPFSASDRKLRSSIRETPRHPNITPRPPSTSSAHPCVQTSLPTRRASASPSFSRAIGSFFGGQPAFLDRQHRSSTDEIPPASVKLRAIRVKTSSLPLRPPRLCARRLPSAASFPSCAWARNCLRNCASSPSKKSAKSVVQKNLPTAHLSVSVIHQEP